MLFEVGFGGGRVWGCDAVWLSFSFGVFVSCGDKQLTPAMCFECRIQNDDKEKKGGGMARIYQFVNS